MVGVVHGRRRCLRLHLVNVPRVSHPSSGGGSGRGRSRCRRRVHPRVLLRWRRVGRRRGRQQVRVRHVGGVVGGRVLVGVVRVGGCGVVRVVVAEAARVVVGHRDGRRLPQRAHTALAAAGDVADEASRAGDGRRRRERPDETGEVPWNTALK